MYTLLQTLWGLDVGPARTEAEIAVPPGPISPVIRLSLRARLVNDGFGGLPGADTVVTWEEVGGIEPEPFRILIPAGCFVRNRGFHVEDFRGCGVEVTFDPDGRGPISLPIADFGARLVPRDDGSASFGLKARLGVLRDRTLAHTILGALGGAALEIAIGNEMGSSLPVDVDTVSGIDPQPF